MSFFAAVRFGFVSLLKFGGRQGRAPFWYYVAVVTGLAMLGSIAAILPMMASTFGRMQAFAAQHPDQATIEQGPGSYSIQIHGNHPELMPDMTGVAVRYGALTFVILLLLASAVARRLHDSGRRGWWGAMPLPFLGVGLVGFGRLFGQMQAHPAGPDLGLFGLLFANNLIYLGTVVALIVMLAQPGNVSLNRYGEPPIR